MGEREKQILKTIKEAMPNMSDYDKGYLLGFSESRVSEQKNQKKQEAPQKEE